MRAFTLDGFDAQPSLRDDLPEPEVSDDDVLVRVQASSVNPVDVYVAAGGLRQYAEYDFPVTIGRDYAGVVERVGSGVTRYAAGDEVFGFVLDANPTVHHGSWAELIVVPQDLQIAPKPRGVDVAEAGAAAVTGLSAIAAFDALKLTDGATVLVVGAPGGVGSIFVQLASSAGAHVIATALAEDEEYLRGLGVGELVSRDGDVAAAVRESHPDGIDAILDLVSQAPTRRSSRRTAGWLRRSARRARARVASTSWPSRRRPTCSAWRGCSTTERSGCRSRRPTHWRRGQGRSARSRRRTRRARSQ